MLDALRGPARRNYRERYGAWRYLRGVEHGPGARVWGRPAIEASDLVVGSGLIVHSTYRTTRVAGTGRIRIGDGCFLNHGAWITAAEAVTLGDRVCLAIDAVDMDNNAHGIEGRPIEPAPVVIEDGTWIGQRAIILPGVTVGAMSIVAAGSVVTRDVPPRTLVAGSPARPVRDLIYPDGVNRAWWGGAQ